MNRENYQRGSGLAIAHFMLHGASTAQDLDLSGVLLHFGEIRGCLHLQPDFSTPAKIFLQTDGHFGGNPSFATVQVIHGLLIRQLEASSVSPGRSNGQAES